MTVIYLLLLLVIPFEYFDVNEIHFANINIILFTVLSKISYVVYSNRSLI